MNHRSISIFGAGAWGSALAKVMRQNGTQVTLWNRTPKLGATSDILQTIHPEGEIVLAIAVEHIFNVCQKIEQAHVQPKICWIASKGLNRHTGDVLSHGVQKFFPQCCVGVFSGPNIAREVQNNWPCGMTLACQNGDILEKAKSLFSDTTLGVDTSCDVIGVQWWGALKNIMAIGYGILQQSSLGYNISATFLTLAIKEMAAIVREKGGQSDTTFSFSGIGDLILSSHCPLGRNRAYGQSFPQSPTCLVEGIETLHTFWNHTIQSKHWTLPTPIIGLIFNVLNHQLAIDAFPNQILNLIHQI